MPPEPSAQAKLEKAREHERKYEWLEAANAYRRVLEVDSRTISSIPEAWEKTGFCYHLASRQTEDSEEFEKLVKLATTAYTNAAKVLEKEDVPRSQGKSLQMYSMAEYVRSWRPPSASDKKEMLAKSCELGKRSLEIYKNIGDDFDYGRASNDILTCLLERLYIASDYEEMKKTSQEGIARANEAITALTRTEAKDELLRAYFTASLLGWYTANFADLEEAAKKELVRTSLDYSEKALGLSKEVDNPYYAAFSNWAATLCTLVFTEKAELALEYAQKMLEQGIKVRDNYLKGVACYLLAFVTDWISACETDPDRIKENCKKIINYAEEAIRCLQLVAQDFFIAETYMFLAESYFDLGHDVEKSPEERRIILEKAVSIGRKGLEHAIQSGSPDAKGSTLHALSKAVHFLSNVETRNEEKTRLLQEALDYRKEFDKTVQKAFPFNDWLCGVSTTYEGLIKVDLAKVEKDRDKKRMLLEGAVSDMEEGILRCRRWVSSRHVPAQTATVGSFDDDFGKILNDLYLITKSKKTLGKAVEAYEDAIKHFRNAHMPSRVAESRWKIARTYNQLDECQKAAENFEKASEEYTIAAQSNANFADFYQDHAAYMRAWSEIEKAGFAHECEGYADAMKHYETAANLLKQTKSWCYLSSNFFAWSLLIQAEDFSRKDNSTASIEAFQKAAESFKEAKEAFEKETVKIQTLDEKEMAIELGKASVRREDYCRARIAVEEARRLDREGKHSQSADKYESAANTFERILETMETQTDRTEVEPYWYMSRAWQKMKIADGTSSPDAYREASELFLKAKEHSTKDRTTLLAFGNSAFCKALEHGTRFEATREQDHFYKTKQYLESAANYYLKAGFDEASVWTNATEMLFDAYNYTISAEIETDPQKKTRTYLLAEKCLEQSAKLYESAGYPGKKEEVLKILKKVAEKREFALSLGELFTAPNDAASPHAISAPRLTVEEPVGLLKFEHAFLQANLIVDQTEILVGESLSLEVQLVNLGKDSAFLTKTEEIIPEGFEVIEKPEKYTVNDRFLNLKGRKLAPFETDEIKVKLRPRKKGKFTLTPTIQFMDETGEHRSCELERVTLTVREMGIRGWIKGQ